MHSINLLGLKSDIIFTAGSRTQDQDASPQKVLGTKDGSGTSDLCDSPDSFINPFSELTADLTPSDDPVSKFMESVPSSENGSAGNFREVFLPGVVIHIVPPERGFHLPLWMGCGIQEKAPGYRAYISNRENFKDIIVSPSMFLDHLPWRYLNSLLPMK